MFEDFTMALWNKFKYVARNCERIDIAFYLYLQSSIKQDEWERRKKSDGIKVIIKHADQPLPVDMDKFWPASENEVQLQQFFIKWLINNYNECKPVYLGGSYVGDLTKCIKIQNRDAATIEVLRCDHEEADDRIVFHLHHALQLIDTKRLLLLQLMQIFA